MLLCDLFLFPLVTIINSVKDSNITCWQIQRAETRNWQGFNWRISKKMSQALEYVQKMNYLSHFASFGLKMETVLESRCRWIFHLEDDTCYKTSNASQTVDIHNSWYGHGSIVGNPSTEGRAREADWYPIVFVCIMLSISITKIVKNSQNQKKEVQDISFLSQK